jgi:hypothetical protein
MTCMRTTAALLATSLACALPQARADLLFASLPDATNPSIFSLDTSLTNPPASPFTNTGAPNYPASLAFDAQGNLFANINGNTIEKYTPQGVGSVFATAGMGYAGLAFDSLGNLYTANSGTIEKFTPDGVGTLFASGGALNHGIAGLAFDRFGNLFVGLQNTGEIEKITPAGVGSLFATVSGAAIGLAFDSTGNLFVSHGLRDGAIEKITPDGDGSVFAPGQFIPGALAFDSTGNLYVAGGVPNVSAIEKFTSDGNSSIFWSYGGDAGVAGLAILPSVSSVPEPSVVAMWAAAIGGYGLARLGGRRLSRRRLRLRKRALQV